MIRVGNTVIDPKRDLTAEQKESLKRMIESERIRQGLNPDGSEDNVINRNTDKKDMSSEEVVMEILNAGYGKRSEKNMADKSNFSRINLKSKKIVVTFFTFVYLVITIFTPVNIPKLGIRFVPFYTIGERMEGYYSEGFGNIPSYVRELNVQVLIIEFIIVTIVFAWSLYFFSRRKTDYIEE